MRETCESREIDDRYIETDLKLRRFHGDGDANEENTSHGDRCVALPVQGATVRTTAHSPHLGPEIPSAMAVGCVAVMFSSSTHFLSSTTSIELLTNKQKWFSWLGALLAIGTFWG